MLDNDIDIELAVKQDKPQSSPEAYLPIDVFQTEDELVIQTSVGGATSDDIDLTVTNEMVTIKGNRKPEEKIKSSDYFHQELYWGPFSRAVILPVDVDSEGAKASMKNGVLTIRLPKLEKVRTRKIKISQ
ncbi:MAG TPA: Hsp20/alpha crystallin family protein [Candidatus Paceibacterota bacterium]